MGTGYVRQSAADIVTGADIIAAPLNAEFNQLQSAFNATTGHSHDGTVGEGPLIALTTSISGVLPVANGGIAGIHKVDGTTAPTVNDDSGDGYAVGSMWLDTTNDRAYVAVDVSVGAAVWVYIGNTTGWQPLDATLTALAGVTVAADKLIYATGADAFTTTDLTAFARSILDDANEATFKATVNLEIGTDVQAYNANLAAIAGLAVTDGNIIVGNGSTWVAESGATARASLGLTIGTDVQAYDADLAALAALTGTDTIYYRSAADTWTAVTIGSGLTFSSGTLSSDGNVSDAELSAIAGLTSAADRVPYFTGSGTAALATFTSFGRTLVENANASDARTDLGLVIGTNVQAYNANLAAIAGLTSAADKLPYFTGSGTAALADLTSFGRSLIADANASAARTTLELGNVDNVSVLGVEHMFIDAGAFIPNITNGSSSGIVELGTNDIPMLSLDFDTSTQEFAIVKWIPPKRWDGGTITFTPYWTAASGSGGVVWAMDGVAISNDDALDAAFGTEQTSTDTFITANDLHVGPTSNAITIAGTPTNADLIWLRIKRNVSDGSDTLGVDAKLLGVVIGWTSEAGTDD